MGYGDDLLSEFNRIFILSSSKEILLHFRDVTEDCHPSEQLIKNERRKSLRDLPNEEYV